MRHALWIAAAALLCRATPAEARLFYQTYGSTVPADGSCVWNMNQDYFVPRHCHTGRYGLFGACKESHTTSPACRHCHPVHQGYCTPFGPCRYCWRDHVYKAHCGCTPLAAFLGPWQSLYCGCCRPPLARLFAKHAAQAGGVAGGASVPVDGDRVACVVGSGRLPCHVESTGIELLGYIAADPEAVLMNSALSDAAAAAAAAQPGSAAGKWGLPSFGTPRSSEPAAGSPQRPIGD